MKTSAKSIFLVITIFVCFAFTTKLNPNVAGVYGVGDTDPSQIELSLMEDGKFTYQDLSSAIHPIRTQGVWVQKGNKVILQSEDNHLRFHKVWHIEPDAKAASARKGLCFYRLVKK